MMSTKRFDLLGCYSNKTLASTSKEGISFSFYLVDRYSSLGFLGLQIPHSTDLISARTTSKRYEHSYNHEKVKHYNIRDPENPKCSKFDLTRFWFNHPSGWAYNTWSWCHHQRWNWERWQRCSGSAVHTHTGWSAGPTAECHSPETRRRAAAGWYLGETRPGCRHTQGESYLILYLFSYKIIIITNI